MGRTTEISKERLNIGHFLLKVVIALIISLVAMPSLFILCWLAGYGSGGWQNLTANNAAGSSRLIEIFHLARFWSIVVLPLLIIPKKRAQRIVAWSVVFAIMLFYGFMYFNIARFISSV